MLIRWVWTALIGESVIVVRGGRRELISPLAGEKAISCT